MERRQFINSIIGTSIVPTSDNKKEKSRTLRVWRLGSLEHRILPTEASIKKLTDLLMTEDMTDLIWGPELEVIDLPGNVDGVIVSDQEFHEAINYIRSKRKEVNL